MEASYRLKANEINQTLIDTIKKLFSGKEITITITPVPDETTYLTMNAENEKHLMESMAEEPTVHFTPGEFKEKVSKL
jgi:hypothetical protein